MPDGVLGLLDDVIANPPPASGGAPASASPAATAPTAGDPGSVVTYDLGDGAGPRTGIVAHRSAASYGLTDGSGVGFKLVQDVQPPSVSPDGSTGSVLGLMDQAIAGKLPAPGDATPPGKLSGPVANTAAGFYQALPGILGAPVDLTAAAMRNGPGSPAPMPAAFAQQHPDAAAFRDWLSGNLNHPVGGSGTFQNLLGLVGADPNKVVANNNLDRTARAAGSGIAQMTVPFAGANAALRAGAAPGALLDTLANGSLAGNAAIGAGAGAGGYAGQTVAPPSAAPVANLGGQLLGGGLVGGALAAGKGLLRATGDALGDYLGPMNAPPWLQKMGVGRDQPLGGGADGQPLSANPAQQRLAGQRIAAASSNRADLAGNLDAGLEDPELVPGSAPTTFQLTGDPGLGQLERAQATKNPDLFNTRRADQNAARVGAIENLAPSTASSGSVGDLMNRGLAALDAQHDNAVAAAASNRDTAVNAMGGQGAVGGYGQGMRGELAAANDAARQREAALWEAIDPTGTKAMDVSPVRQAAKDIAGGVSKSAKPPEGEEADIYGVASKHRDVEPYAEIKDLRSRTLAAIRAERRANGSTPAMARMQQFRQALDDAISGAVEKQAAAGPDADAQIRAVLASASMPDAGSTVYTPSGRSIGVRYEVVDAGAPKSEPTQPDALITSNTDDGRVNPAYPAELQPRDRTRAASGAQIARMAGNLQPERLGASASAMEGAPIVGPDGVVESGNARTLAITRAYRDQGPQAQAYRDYLERQGFDTSGMAAPILIRRRVTDLAPKDRVAFAQEANANPGLAMSATEQAAQDAQRLPDAALGLYRGGEITSRDNADFRRAFMRAVPQKGEEGSFAAADGSLSVQGQQRIRNALLAKAYGDPNLVSALAETGDPDIRAFGGALTEIAPRVAQLKAQIAAGRVQPDMDIAPALVEAASVVRSARSAGVPLRDARREQNMAVQRTRPLSSART